MVESTAQSIIEFAVEQAKKEWDASQSPYFLSRLSPDLAARGVDYREVLGEQKLKDFIQASQDKVTIVSHPTQRSKIGIVPVGEHYEYPAEDSQPSKRPVQEARPERSGASRRRYIVSNFLQLVGELDDVDAAQVQIPTIILTKLMRER